jgi:hypothetical protein
MYYAEEEQQPAQHRPATVVYSSTAIVIFGVETSSTILLGLVYKANCRHFSSFISGVVVLPLL